MKIDIIIPFWNHSEETINCLKSIKKNTSLPIRLLLINNGSKALEMDKIMDFLKTSGVENLVQTNEKNLGFVKATNQGLKRSTGDFVCLLNNDTIVYPGWLEEMVKIMYSDERVGIVGGLTTNSYYQGVEKVEIEVEQKLLPNPLPLKGKDTDWEKVATWLYEKNKGKYFEKPVLSFQCVLLRRFMVEQIGVLDEDFGMGLADDDEYCARARHFDWTLAIALGSFIYHMRRTTFNDIPNWKDEQQKNVRLLYKKIENYKNKVWNY